MNYTRVLAEGLRKISSYSIEKKIIFRESSSSESIDLAIHNILNELFKEHNLEKILTGLDGSISPYVGNGLNLSESVFSPRFDEKFFYLRSNTHYQSGKPAPQFSASSDLAVANKEYLLDSYEWNSLLSIHHLNKIEPDEVLSSVLQNIEYGRVYQLHFFNLMETNQASWKYFLTGRELVNLMVNKARFLRFCQFEHFEFIALRPHTKPGIATAPIENFKETSTTVVLFIDSLDRRILSLEGSQSILPNLHKLKSRGVTFNGFTSSASWTYPVLSSIYSGINSAVDLRLWRHPWPFDFISNNHLLSNCSISDRGEQIQSLRKCLHEQFGVQNYHPFRLARNLSNVADVYGIKNSLNHSWRHGMSSYYKTSLEKAGYSCKVSLEKFNDVMRSSSGNKVVFIDLDHAHRHTLPRTNYPVDGLKPKHDNTDFLNSLIMPQDTLTGNLTQEMIPTMLRKYADIDRNISDIINHFGFENVDYILFADHGSSFMDHLTNEDVSKLVGYQQPSSSVRLNKIATPLLMYVPSESRMDHKLFDQEADSTCSELVSSEDLGEIILKLADPNYLPPVIPGNAAIISATLPKFFGGAGRSFAISTGYIYSDTKDSTSMELMRRNSLECYSYANIQLVPQYDQVIRHMMSHLAPEL